MFASTTRMKHVTLLMLDADAQKAAGTLSALEVIHLIPGSPDPDRFNEMPAAAFQTEYTQLQTRLKKIRAYLPDAASHVRLQAGPVSLERLQQANTLARRLWQSLSTHEENLRKARETIHSATQLSESLGKFENLQFDLRRLVASSRFMQIFLGTVPQTGIAQLERALALANTVIEVFQQTDQHAFVSVVTETGNTREVSEILKAANFHAFTLPPELQGEPQHIRKQIQQQLIDSQGIIERESMAIRLLLKQQQHELAELQQVSRLAAPYAALAGSLSGKGQLVTLQGWMPAEREQEVTAALNQSLSFPFQFDTRIPRPTEMAEVPSLQKGSRLLLPFQALVRQFGIPSYGEVDPSLLFALSYLLMFGAMFGDIGHGAIFILTGWLLRHKLPGLFTFLMLAGLSSMLFGYLYGSLFGFEHVVHAAWMSPMQDPILMLQLALGWGIGFISLVSLLSIYNLYQLGEVNTALYSGRGIAGLMFFASGVFAGWQFMTQQTISLIAITAMLLPLGVVLFHHWQQLQGSLPEKVLVSLIEALDSFINNLSNTLSFLRVAAFSLNHAALAAAVFTLAAMMDTTGHWLTIILGNLFIIVLEGGIVAIQCLRLEYYEGFSRFFRGQGLRFEPLKNPN